MTGGLPGHVLVLNQDYQALSVCSVQRAVVLMLLQKAELVEAAAGREVRTARTHFAWPSVVRLKGYVRVPYRRVLLTRRNIFRRDDHICQYCGAADRLTLDHVLPKSRGGPDSWENLVAACVPCNNRKGNRTPEEAGMPLRRAPFRPSHVMYLRDFFGAGADDWKPFLYAA
jgi:5-methylcytosine-specific restriction endonuclease McrA